MHSRTFLVLLILFTFCSLVFPSSAEEITLTDDEKAFLSDMVGTGIPMLYQTAEAMNTGVFYGSDTAIADIASEKKKVLTEFTDKISGYTLGTESAALRESWLTAGESLQGKLDEYATLNPGCGSCISTMNAMYPVLIESADSVDKSLISFCVKNQVTL